VVSTTTAVVAATSAATGRITHITTSAITTGVADHGHGRQADAVGRRDGNRYAHVGKKAARSFTGRTVVTTDPSGFCRTMVSTAAVTTPNCCFAGAGVRACAPDDMPSANATPMQKLVLFIASFSILLFVCVVPKCDDADDSSQQCSRQVHSERCANNVTCSAMRILVVEDDPAAARAIAEAISQARHNALAAASAEHARTLLNTEPIDLAIVDLGLPGADGFSLVKRLRHEGRDLPVLILTGRSGIDDRVNALDLGADDYLTKPFEPRELVARCRALLRRANGRSSNLLEIGALRIDLRSGRVRIDNRDIDISRNERIALETLCAKAGSVVEKNELATLLAYDGEELSCTRWKPAFHGCAASSETAFRSARCAASVTASTSQ
jgi:DNA-binding response OmpR family regulator